VVNGRRRRDSSRTGRVLESDTVSTVKATLEREVKLQPPEGFDLSGFEGEPRSPRVFESTYYDTVDRRLAREGVTLRRRVENGAGAWQLKLPQGAARLELELEGDEAVPDRAVALLVGLTRRRPLELVARLRTQRETLRCDATAVSSPRSCSTVCRSSKASASPPRSTSSRSN
jgi:hypothetical protein